MLAWSVTDRDPEKNRLSKKKADEPGPKYVPELEALATRAEPMRFGPVKTIGTTLTFDAAAAQDVLEDALGDRRNRIFPGTSLSATAL